MLNANVSIHFKEKRKRNCAMNSTKLSVQIESCGHSLDVFCLYIFYCSLDFFFSHLNYKINFAISKKRKRKEGQNNRNIIEFRINIHQTRGRIREIESQCVTHKRIRLEYLEFSPKNNTNLHVNWKNPQIDIIVFDETFQDIYFTVMTNIYENNI